MLFSDNTMTLEGPRVTEDEPIDEETMQMRKMLKTPLEDMELSVRAKNCLKAADIKTMGELVQLEIADMMKFRNFGKKSLTELENLVEERGLEFGMDLGKYRLEED
jgi:DNA-directed RNA polymerase subunit alpha